MSDLILSGMTAILARLGELETQMMAFDARLARLENRQMHAFGPDVGQQGTTHNFHTRLTRLEDALPKPVFTGAGDPPGDGGRG